MPITVRCHACDGRALCPDKTAGKRIKCPRCGAELRVPRPVALSEPTTANGSNPDWAAAPPPVRAAAPTESAAADWSGAPPPIRAAVPVAHEAPAEPVQAEPDSSRWDMDDGPAHYEPPEPWYYGFLEKYTLFFMWAGIISCTLLFAGFTVLTLFGGVAVAAATTKTGTGAAGGTMLLEGGLAVYWIVGAIAYAAAVAVWLFSAARILLAVDAARNLRAIRFKAPGPHW